MTLIPRNTGSAVYSVMGKVPSANRMYRQMKGNMVKTDAVRAYAKMIAAEYRVQGGRAIEGAWVIDVDFHVWDRRDLDNCLKVFIDAVKVATGCDDRWCYGISTRKFGHHDPSGKSDLVEFTITPVETGLRPKEEA